MKTIYEVPAGAETKLFTNLKDALEYFFYYLNNGEEEVITNVIREYLKDNDSIVDILTKVALYEEMEELSTSLYAWVIETITKENIIEHKNIYSLVKKIENELDFEYFCALNNSLNELIS